MSQLRHAHRLKSTAAGWKNYFAQSNNHRREFQMVDKLTVTEEPVRASQSLRLHEASINLLTLTERHARDATQTSYPLAPTDLSSSRLLIMHSTTSNTMRPAFISADGSIDFSNPPKNTRLADDATPRHRLGDPPDEMRRWAHQFSTAPQGPADTPEEMRRWTHQFSTARQGPADTPEEMRRWAHQFSTARQGLTDTPSFESNRKRE